MGLVASNLLLGNVFPIFNNSYPTVYAEDEEESTNTDDESSAGSDESSDDSSGGASAGNLGGNIYADGNQDAVAGFEAAAQYNIGMQYLTTYNVLSSTLNQVSRNSPYSKITKGEHNGAFEGVIGSAVKAKVGEVKSKYEEYIDQLDPDTQVDPDYNGDGVQDAGEQRPSVDQFNNDEASGNAQQHRDAFIKVVVEELIKVYDGNLTLDSGNLVTSTSEFNLAGTKFPTGTVAYRKLSGKANPFKQIGGGTKDVMREILTDYITKNHMSVLKRTDGWDTFVDSMATEVQRGAIKWGQEKGVIDRDVTNFAGLFHQRLLGSFEMYGKRDNDGHKYQIQNGTGNPHIILPLGSNNRFGQQSKHDTQVVVSLLLANAKSSVHTNSIKDYTAAKKEFANRIKNTNEYKQYQQAMSDASVGANGYSLLMWTTLAPTTTSKFSGDAEEKFNEALKGFDESVVAGNTLETSSGDERLIVAGDMFLSKKNYSPVFLGANAKDFFSNPQDHIKLDVGKSGGGFDSKDVPLSALLGVQGNWVPHVDISLGALFGFGGENKVEFSSDSEVLYFPQIVGSSGSLGKILNVRTNSAANKFGSSYKANGMMHVFLSGNPEQWGGEFSKTMVGSKDLLIGVDNYGNIVGGTNGAVLIPYWQNPYFEPLNTINSGDNMVANNQILGSDRDADDAMSGVIKALSQTKVLEKTKKDNWGDLIGNDASAKALIEKVQAALPSVVNENDLSNAVREGIGGVSAEDTRKALAVIITGHTKDKVSEFNRRMLDAARNAGRLMVDFDDADLNNNNDSDSDNRDPYRWTAASIIQKIGYFFDYGIYETLQLTASRTTASFYNNTIKNSGLEEVFYTETILDSDTGSFYVVLVATLLSAVMAVYVVWSALRVLRGAAVVKDVITRFLVIAMILSIPTVIYKPLTKYVLNEPAQHFLKDQMKAVVVLDTYLANDQIKKDINEYYGNMFGRTDATSELSTGNYYIQIPTTMDKNGFDINIERWSNPDLSFTEARRLRDYQERGKDYPEENLVMVNVALIDLYKWVWDQSGLGPTGEVIPNDSETEEVVDEDGTTITINTETGDREWANDIGEIEVNTEATDVKDIQPLFEWLAMGGGSKHKVTGYSADLATYDEYAPNLVMPFAVRYPQVKQLLTNVNSGSGLMGSIISALSNIASNLLDRVRTVGAVEMSSSQTFYNVVMSMMQGNVSENIGKLYDFARLVNGVKIDGGIGAQHYIPTGREIQAVMRDLSSTKAARTDMYGAAGWSPMSRVVVQVGNSLTVKDIRNFYANSNIESGASGEGAGGALELPVNPNFSEPANDFLNVTSLITSLLPESARQATQYTQSNTFGNKTLAGDIYDINHGTISEYITNYYITRASMGSTRNQEALNHAEQMVMATEVFFQLNKALRINGYPKGFYVGGVTYDKYLSTMFIPLKDYGEPTLNFHEFGAVIPRSTAEYISMNSNLLEFILFIIAVIVVAILGLIYIAVFYFILLFLIMFNCIKNYVFKGDYSNKSWLGILFIYGAFGLSKMIFVMVWGILVNFMNGQAARSMSGHVPYPFVGAHALVLIALGSFLIWFLTTKVIGGVFQDLDNLGGEHFMTKLGELSGKFKGKTSGNMRSTNKSGTSAREATRKEGAGGRHRFNGFGNSAAMMGSAGLLNGAASRLGSNSVVSSTAVEQASAEVNAKISEPSVNSLQGSVGSYKATHGIVDDKIVLNEGTAKNNASRQAYFKQLKKVNSIDSTVGGVAEDVLMGAEAGSILSSSANTMVTEMAVGSSEAAEIVAASLVAKGLHAVSSGGNVIFDSTGYNLKDSRVRAELFRGSANTLQEAYGAVSTNLSESKVEDGALGYSITNSRAGLATVNFDANTGLHPTTFEALTNSEVFRRNFIAPTLTAKNLDSKGNVKGDLELQFKDLTMSSEQQQQALEELYAVDTTLRTTNKLSKQKTNNKYNSKLSFNGLSTDERSKLEKMAKDNHMLMQGNELYFDSGNKRHSALVNDYRQQYQTEKESLSNNLQAPSANLVNYIRKGGSNGVAVKTSVEGSKQAVMAGASLYAGGRVVRQGLQQVKVANTKGVDQMITQRRDDLHAITEFAQSSQTNASVVNKFQHTKEELNNYAQESLTSKVGNKVDSSKYIQAVESHISKTSLRDSKGFNGLQEQSSQLNNLYKTNRISEDEYLKHQKVLANSYRAFMEDTGIADEFSLGVAKTHNSKGKNLHSKYFTELSEIQNNAGVQSRETLMKAKSKHLKTNSKLVSDKEALQVRNGVASIAYKKDDVINKVGVEGANGGVERYILGTNESRDYRDSTVSTFIRKTVPVMDDDQLDELSTKRRDVSKLGADSKKVKGTKPAKTVKATKKAKIRDEVLDSKITSEYNNIGKGSKGKSSSVNRSMSDAVSKDINTPHKETTTPKSTKKPTSTPKDAPKTETNPRRRK